MNLPTRSSDQPDLMMQEMEELKRLPPLQFSLRWVLLATLAIAALFAIVGPWLRQFSTPRLAFVAAAWLGAILLWLFFLRCFSRMWARRRAGGGLLLYVLPGDSRPWRTRLFCIMGVVPLACACLNTYKYLALDGATGSESAWSSALVGSRPLFVCLLIGSYVLALIGHCMLRARDTLFCANGLVNCSRLTAWSEITHDEWRDRTEVGDLGQLWFHRSAKPKRPLRLDVSTRDRAAVEELLEQVRPLYDG